MSLRGLTPLGIALAVGLALSMLRVGGCRPLDVLDLRALDQRIQQRGRGVAAPEVVIVAVDDASLGEIGRWPWSRARIADLIERVDAGDPAVIGIDLVQAEPTAACDVGAIAAAVDPSCQAALTRALGGVQGEDARLVEAVRASGRTVLGYFFDFSPGGDDSPSNGESAYATVQRAPGADSAPIQRARRVTQNLPPLAAAAAGLGYFNFFPDRDGLFRRVPMAIAFGDRVTMPLSLAVLRHAWPQRPAAIRLGPYGVESLRLGAELLPVDRWGQLLINYRGPRRTFRHVSAADVLAGRVSPDVFRNALVLLGVTAVGVGDVRNTPFDPVYPGVEIHATVLDNILRRDFLYRPAIAGSIALYDVAVILLVAVLVGAALHRTRGMAGALVAAGLLAAYVVGSQLVFAGHGAVLSFAYPALCIALSYVGVGVHQYAVTEREKRQTRRMLDLYLSPELSRYLSERPETLQLGGEKSERTVLFSDVKGFTGISERLSAEDLVEVLNLYLGEMTEAVFAHGGMLDKYIGDGLMAVWGAPVAQPDHAARACRAALEMLERLQALNRKIAARGWPTLGIRIGINSGPMVFGNMGSPGHLSLTVMGDNVNLAARLEGINKLYGSAIIASDRTVQLAGDSVVARELDLVRVRGRDMAVHIYEILGSAAAGDGWRELNAHFAAGLAAYRARDWTTALAAFEAAARARHGDGPTELYLWRCRDYLRDPPPPDWEAVTKFSDA
ncbi:MAG: CHASE2 domain-containing protein [Candidatus Binatia bacterium]